MEEGMKMSALMKFTVSRSRRRRYHKGYYDRSRHYHGGYWEYY